MTALTVCWEGSGGGCVSELIFLRHNQYDWCRAYETSALATTSFVELSRLFIRESSVKFISFLFIS